MIQGSLHLAIVCGLGTALFWGLNPLLIKQGLRRDMDQARGTCYMLLSHLVSMILLSSFFGKWAECPQLLGKAETIWLALAGVSNYVLGLFYYFKSIPRLGASRAASIVNASPGLSVVLAVIFLQEKGSPMVWAGVVLILGGVYLIGRG